MNFLPGRNKSQTLFQSQKVAQLGSDFHISQRKSKEKIDKMKFGKKYQHKEKKVRDKNADITLSEKAHDNLREKVQTKPAI